MADEADRAKSPESDKLLLDLAWERQQKKVSAVRALQLSTLQFAKWCATQSALNYVHG